MAISHGIIMKDEEIFNCYIKIKQSLLNIASQNINISKGITIVEVEQVVDELIFKVLNAKPEFESTIACKSYMYKVLDTELKILHSRTKKENLIPYTGNQMLENFIVATNIIDGNHAAMRFSDEMVQARKRDNHSFFKDETYKSWDDLHITLCGLKMQIKKLKNVKQNRPVKRVIV